MLHHVHQEERIALRALEDERHEGGGDRPPQALGHIRRHRLGGQEFQTHFHRLPPPTQLLDDAAQGMRPDRHLHRPIGPQHQQPCGSPALRQIGQGLHGGVITPLQVFEHQHQWRLGGQHVEGLGQLAQHPGGGRPLHLALQVLQLGLAEHPEQLHQPQRGIAAQHGQHGRVLWPAAELPQRLQEGEVRFPLAIVLGALAPGDPHPTPGAQVGQHHIHHGRLANPGFATEQDELAGALGRPLEPLR